MSTQKAVVIFNFLRIVIEKKRIKIIKLLKKMGKKMENKFGRLEKLMLACLFAALSQKQRKEMGQRAGMVITTNEV